MRRSVITSLFVLSLTALSIAATACATAPYDDNLSGLTQEQKPTDPGAANNNSAKLPPSNPAKEQPVDAGSSAPKDSGSSSTSQQDSSAPPPATDSGSPATTGADCDPNNMNYYLEFVMATNPSPCPCSASECCYLGVGCVAK